MKTAFLLLTLLARGYDLLPSEEKPLVLEYEMVMSEGRSKHLSAVLFYHEGVSVYKWNDTSDASDEEMDNSGNLKFYIDVVDSVGTINITHYKADSIYTRSRLLSEVLLLKEKREKLNWEITGESKKTGDYTAFKATCRFRGRDYTAWYTEDIPISIGPWKLNGLPGAIIEAYDDESMVYFSLKKVHFRGRMPAWASIARSVDKTVNLKQYEAIRSNISKEILKRITAKIPRSATVSIDAVTENFLERSIHD